MAVTDLTATDAFTVIAETDGMDRAEWLDGRRQGIGGSDAAAICGQDRWRSTFEVWLDKTGAPGLDDDRENEAMAWGRILEPVVATQVAERTGLEIVTDKKLLASTQRPWQLANLDGWAHSAEDVGVYEGKTAGYFAGEAWDDDQVPDSYVLQGMHYLAVTGRQWLLYGVLIGGQRLEIRRVERDQELIDHLITIEADFWHHVTERIPPPVDGSKACTDLLAHLWDVKEGAVTTVDPTEVVPMLERRAELVDEIKAVELAKADIENRLKLLLAENEEAIDPDGRRLFSWKWVETNRVDTKALQEQRPEIADAFTTTSGYRRFHVAKGALR